MWRLLTLVGEHLDAINRKLMQVVVTEHTAVISHDFSTLMAVVQLLIWYFLELTEMHCLLYNPHLTNARFLHIALKARWYSLFDIIIEDLVIAALDL